MTKIDGKTWHCPACGHTELHEVHLVQEIRIPIENVEKAEISLRVLKNSNREIIARTVDGFYCNKCNLYLCQNTRNESVEKRYERLLKAFPGAFFDS